MQADNCITDGEGVARPVTFGVRFDAPDEEVWPQSPHIVPEDGDGAVGGDEQVPDIEALGTVVGDQACVGSGVGAYFLECVVGVPNMTVDAWDPVWAGVDGDRHQAVLGPAGEWSTGAPHVHDPVAGDAVGG